MMISWKEVLRLKEKTHLAFVFCASQQFAFLRIFLGQSTIFVAKHKIRKSA